MAGSVRINYYEDRNNVITALVNAGYKVWTEERKAEIGGEYPMNKKDYWVCWEESEVEK